MCASPSVDPAAFRALEHAGWEGSVDSYDAAFRTLTAQTIDPLLDAAGVGHGVRVLDEATGPGYVAAVAAQRGTNVTAADFSARWWPRPAAGTRWRASRDRCRTGSRRSGGRSSR